MMGLGCRCPVVDGCRCREDRDGSDRVQVQTELVARVFLRNKCLSATITGLEVSKVVLHGADMGGSSNGEVQIAPRERLRWTVSRLKVERRG